MSEAREMLKKRYPVPLGDFPFKRVRTTPLSEPPFKRVRTTSLGNVPDTKEFGRYRKSMK